MITASLIFLIKKHILPVHFTPSHKHDTVLDKGNQYVTKVEDFELMQCVYQISLIPIEQILQYLKTILCFLHVYTAMSRRVGVDILQGCYMYIRHIGYPICIIINNLSQKNQRKSLENTPLASASIHMAK